MSSRTSESECRELLNEKELEEVVDGWAIPVSAEEHFDPNDVVALARDLRPSETLLVSDDIGEILPDLSAIIISRKVVGKHYFARISNEVVEQTRSIFR